MLRISAQLRQSMVNDARREQPRECCGILTGEAFEGSRIAWSAVPCVNIAQSPEVRYDIGTEELLHAQKSAREAKSQIVGFYHSHPKHEAMPSETDLKEAYWTNCSYVIVSLLNEEEQLRSFVLRENGGVRSLEEEQIEIA